jgi:hypothetical protein
MMQLLNLKSYFRAGGMAQVVELLFSKALSSNTRTTKMKKKKNQYTEKEKPSNTESPEINLHTYSQLIFSNSKRGTNSHL